MRALRAGLVLFFALVVLEGALRKWLFPGQQQIVYVIKDGLLVLLVLWAGITGRLRIPDALRGGVTGFFLTMYVVWTAVEVFNPALPRVLLGVWGFKTHCLYLSLVLLVPAAFTSTEEVFKWTRRYLYVAAPVFILGVVQFLSPRTSVLNKYVAGGEEAVSTVGRNGLVRITGTFPYITGMTTYVFVMIALAIAVLGASRGSRTQSASMYAIVALGMLVTPMTGSRWGVYIWILILPLMLFDLLRHRSAGILPALSAVLVAVAVMSYSGREAASAFGERARTAGDDQRRISDVLTQPLEFADDARIAGFGAGATHQAASVLVTGGASYWWLPELRFEDEPGRVMLELGVLGFVIVLAAKISMLRLARRAFRNARDPRAAALATAASAVFLAHLTTPVIFNSTAGAYFWGFAGMLMVLLRSHTVQPGVHQWQQRAPVRIS